MPTELGRPLTHGDIASSLRKGGTIVLTVRCSDGRFVATTLDALPPGRSDG